AHQLEVEPLLPQRFFRLTDERILLTALIHRDGQRADGGGVPRLRRGTVLYERALRNARLGHQGWVERAFVDLDLKERDVDAIHRRGHVWIFHEPAIDRGRHRRG